MIPTAAEVLAQAAHWIGYKEKKSNAYLLNYNANSGSNNYTIFGKDVSNPKYWNGNKQGADWCTSFVTACILYAAGGTPDGGKANERFFVDVKNVQPYTSLGASCKYETNAYKKAKRWSETPAVGDQAFFKRGHTGLVEKVGTKTVTLIEGNSNNRVERRTYSFPNAIFSGFGRPFYAEPAASAPPKVTHTVVPCDTPERIARKYGITPQELIAANIAKYPKITIDFIRDGWVLTIPESKGTATAFKAYYAKTDAEKGLNVRTGAGTTYKILGVLPYGTKVHILEEKGKWGRIVYNDKAGWIALSYTRKV